LNGGTVGKLVRWREALALGAFEQEFVAGNAKLAEQCIERSGTGPAAAEIDDSREELDVASAEGWFEPVAEAGATLAPANATFAAKSTL
jgi:hypothetical protein